MKTTKPKNSTTHARVSAAKSHLESFPIPSGYKKLYRIDKKRWETLCKARESWSENELMMLYEIVVGYRDLDKARKVADDAPLMIEKVNGDEIANPIFHEVRQREKGIRDWNRQVGLQVTQERANSGNGSGKTAKTEVPDKLPDNVASLIG
jgi:hypothetical protein